MRNDPVARSSANSHQTIPRFSYLRSFALSRLPRTSYSPFPHTPPRPCPRAPTPYYRLLAASVAAHVNCTGELPLTPWTTKPRSPIAPSDRRDRRSRPSDRRDRAIAPV